MPCVFFFFIKGVQILSPSYYFRWLEALRGQQWNGKEHGSLLLELMLTESERSCHVFWQLTQWVWILQHKVGPFSLSTCLLGNVPSSCFHIDLITLPHWWAWHKNYFLYCCVHHTPSPTPPVLLLWAADRGFGVRISPAPNPLLSVPGLQRRCTEAHCTLQKDKRVQWDWLMFGSRVLQ